MGYRMKGSPAKLGNIQGTEGHKSALKLVDFPGKKGTGKYSENIYTKDPKTGTTTVKVGGKGKSITTSKDIEAYTTHGKTGMVPKKKRSYAEAYKKRDMKTYGKLSLKEYTAEAKRQKASKKAGKGWDAPTKPMKTTPKVTTTKVDKKDDSKKVVVKKDDTTPKDTYGTRTEAEQDLDVRMAKRGRKKAKKAAKRDVKIARATYGRRSEEVKAAKKVKKATKRTERKKVLEAKKEDYRDDRGIFAGLRRGRTKRRLKRTEKRIAKKGDVETLATKKEEEV